MVAKLHLILLTLFPPLSRSESWSPSCSTQSIFILEASPSIRYWTGSSKLEYCSPGPPRHMTPRVQYSSSSQSRMTNFHMLQASRSHMKSSSYIYDKTTVSNRPVQFKQVCFLWFAINKIIFWGNSVNTLLKVFL